MADSTHIVEVVRLPEFHKHPNADTLSLVSIYSYPVVIRTEDWEPGQLAAYIPPDSLVPDTELFSFLNGHRRIRAIKLRGEVSFGLLVPAPEGSKEGDDVADELGVCHWQPTPTFGRGPNNTKIATDSEPGPKSIVPVYDVETWYKYSKYLNEGEEVVVTEKIHGCNARFGYSDGRMWVGSHRNWKKQDPNNLWWQALEQNPWIEAWCKAHPDYFLYGEVYGQVQDLSYDQKPGIYKVRIFDILALGAGLNRWVNWCDLEKTYRVWDGPLQWVPILYVGPYDPEHFKTLINGKSTIASHMREGVVIRPTTERWEHIGRVQLKAVSADYLLRKSK